MSGGLAPPPSIDPEQIRQIRMYNNFSQRVFALYLEHQRKHDREVETGAKRLSGPALKLLWIVQKRGLDVLV